MSNSQNTDNIPSAGFIPKTYCSTKIQVHELCFVWEIENFTFHHKKGVHFMSPLFSSATDGEYKWILYLNPNGNNGMVDLKFYLSAVSTIEKCFVKYVVTILDSEGKRVQDTRKEYDFCEYNKSQNNEFKPLISKNVLFQKSSTLLPNDKLTIMCNAVFSPMNASHVIFRQVKSIQQSSDVQEKVLHDFGALLNDQLFTDVVLIANGKEYPAHKTILAARSSVFAAMFTSNMVECEKNRVEIKDIDGEILDNILRYIYTGKYETSVKLVDRLLVAAEKYDLQMLRKMCEEQLMQNLSIENWLDTLILADMNCASVLKSETIAFVVVNFTEIKNTEVWKNLNQSYIHLVKEICEALSARSNNILYKYLKSTN